MARRAHALPAGGPAVPTPISPGLPAQAYTLRTAARISPIPGAGLALGAPTVGQSTGQLATQMDIDQEYVAFVRADRAAIEAMLTELAGRVGDDASDQTDTDASAR